ncbi:LIG4 [Lepeophtheirus salmonis]|uniref:LIG4 n=1 Tax=Lepeophtheirus salmonis TaxID=72036 RepID=A0A7R8CHN9_LEPSM|nr:LIG4 [Lepeophtheirus salmonis]CAF2825613.1 LIG4 [Lepeophtheirus salmonis]
MDKKNALLFRPKYFSFAHSILTQILCIAYYLNYKMLEPFAKTLENEYQIVLSAEENLNKQDYLDKPQEYAMKTAALKSRAVIEEIKKKENKNLLVIGSDTVVFSEGQIIGKPKDMDDAILESLSDKSHQVYTGVSILIKPSDFNTIECHSFYEETKIYFDKLPLEVIEGYVSTGEPIDKAGAYGIQSKGGTLIKRIEGDYFNDCRSLWNDKQNYSLFPIVRLLLPNLDRERKSFGIKETVLAKLYIDMLSLGSDSKDAIKLKTYRVPKGGQSIDVMKDPLIFPFLNFNEMLNEIADESGGRKSVEHILGSMFRKMNAVQQKWTVRIILKDTKLGLGLNTILGVIHDDAKEYYEAHANLRMVCEKLKDRNVSVNEIQIRLMDPFKPMLADRMPVTKIESTYGGRPFYIEKKYDGERLQIHFQRYPDVQFKFFHAMFFNDFTSLIVDGEICTFNRHMDIIMQKGDQHNIRAIKADDPDLQQCFCIYDILLLNELLRDNFKDKEMIGRFVLAENWKGEVKQDAIDALNDAIDRREEGIVLKDPQSVYKPGARAGGGWIKLKPEYAEQIVDTLDLVILGGYYGSVGSGYSMRELLNVLQKISPNFSKTLPNGIKYQNKAGGRADVWIDPKKSVILQVKATEFIYSDLYATGVSLRFPRVETVRHDKSWNDCMTLSEMSSLKELGDGKLNRAKRTAKVYSSLQGPEKTDVIIQTLDLKDKVIVVEPANTKLKKELEEIVIKYGGNVEQNVSENQTYAYVETGLKIRAKGIIKSGKYDVVKSSWLLDCDEKGFRAFGPCDMVFTTTETLNSFRENYDKFDDPYFERTNIDGLKYSITKVKELEEELSLDSLDIAEFEDKFYSSPSSYVYGLFRKIESYFDIFEEFFVYKQVRDELDPLHFGRICFEFYGGSFPMSSKRDRLSHVFVNTDETERIKALKNIRKDWKVLDDILPIFRPENLRSEA